VFLQVSHNLLHLPQGASTSPQLANDHGSYDIRNRIENGWFTDTSIAVLDSWL
jgi:hypothetical protein